MIRQDKCVSCFQVPDNGNQCISDSGFDRTYKPIGCGLIHISLGLRPIFLERNVILIRKGNCMEAIVAISGSWSSVIAIICLSLSNQVMSGRYWLFSINIHVRTQMNTSRIKAK